MIGGPAFIISFHAGNLRGRSVRRGMNTDPEPSPRGRDHPETGLGQLSINALNFPNPSLISELSIPE